MKDGDSENERAEFLFGRGGWPAFRNIGAKLSDIESAATAWEVQFRGIDKPWLVWNAHHDWCWVQQNLVESVGWTPVIGYDPRIGPPPAYTKNAVLINFNADLQLSYMHPVFVLEFMYAFADKLAFWHSDLLVPLNKLRSVADRFETLEQGETIATSTFRMKRFWRRPGRVWELLGCTTRDASRHQFEVGSGWWSNFFAHINCPSETEAEHRKRNSGWDHGSGILYWKRYYGGRLKTIPLSLIEKYHFSPTSHPKIYKRIGPTTTRNLSKQLDGTISLKDACYFSGIEVPAPPS